MQQHKGNAVQSVVFGCKRDRLSCAVPVECGVKYGFGEIRVGHKISPHSLTLEAAHYRVSALCFLKPAHLGELGISLEDIADNAGHFRDKLPVFLLFLFRKNGAHIGHSLGGIYIDSLGALLLYPRKRLFILRFVEYTQLFSADYLRHIHPFGVNAEIAAEEILVAVRARNAHCRRADIHIALVFHIADCRRAARKTQYLFLDVRGDHLIVRVLYVVAVD